jgi:hypothetical protein
MQTNKGGTLRGEGEVGRVRRVRRVRRVQFTSNQGQEWMGICTTTQKRDFQVSKRGLMGVQVGKGNERELVINKELLRGRERVP